MDVGSASTRLLTALAAALPVAAATAAVVVDTVEVTAANKEVSFLPRIRSETVLTMSPGYGGGGRGKHISLIYAQ
jgi:hypothetical protein